MEAWHSDVWEELRKPGKYGAIEDTGVDIATLKSLGQKITKLPKDLILHKNVQNIMDARKKSYETGTLIDWGGAEALAFSTLISE